MTTNKFQIKWKLRNIAAPQGIKDKDLAERLQISKQAFAYRMKTGFSASEVEALERFLNLGNGELKQ